MPKTRSRSENAAYMREYTRANRDKINAQRRARRTPETMAVEKDRRRRNPDAVREYKHRDRVKRAEQYSTYDKVYRLKNQEKITERKKRDYQANKQTIIARLAKFKKDNPERVKEKQHLCVMRRRARLAGVEKEPIDRQAIYERDGGVCGICHRKVSKRSYSLDHIIPLSKGGPHKRSNLRLANTDCNKRRGNRGPGQLVLDL